MNILAIGAHWDDIELGCGLTLKKLNEKNHDVFSAVICGSQYGEDENEGMKESEVLECGLKSFVFIGPGVSFTNNSPIGHLRDIPSTIRGAKLRLGCAIGGGATICPGVEIGQ